MGGWVVLLLHGILSDCVHMNVIIARTTVVFLRPMLLGSGGRLGGWVPRTTVWYSLHILQQGYCACAVRSLR